MLTQRGAGLLGAAGALWFTGRAFGAPELFVAALAALLAVGVAVGVTRVATGLLEVDRVVRPGTLPFGGQAEVALTVVNRGRLPTTPLAVEDTAPMLLAGSTRAALPSLRSGGRATITYRVEGAQRGRFELGPLVLRLRDPFGLAERTTVLPGTASITVHPPVSPLAPGLPLGGATSGASDGRRRPLPGGDELATIREYVRGDDLRAVHWPSTAHRGKLMVRQTETAEEPRAVLLLDRRRSRHAGSGPSATIETAVAAAASVANHLAGRGRSVVLVDAPVAEPPRAQAWDTVVERLAVTEPGDIDLRPLLVQLGTGIAGDGALIAVVTVPEAEELGLLVRAGRGFSTRAALLVDAPSHWGRPDPDADSSAAALRAAGWRVSVLRGGDRIDERWLELLVQRRAAATTVVG